MPFWRTRLVPMPLASFRRSRRTSSCEPSPNGDARFRGKRRFGDRECRARTELSPARRDQIPFKPGALSPGLGGEFRVTARIRGLYRVRIELPTLRCERSGQRASAFDLQLFLHRMGSSEKLDVFKPYGSRPSTAALTTAGVVARPLPASVRLRRRPNSSSRVPLHQERRVIWPEEAAGDKAVSCCLEHALVFFRVWISLFDGRARITDRQALPLCAPRARSCPESCTFRSQSGPCGRDSQPV